MVCYFEEKKEEKKKEKKKRKEKEKRKSNYLSNLHRCIPINNHNYNFHSILLNNLVLGDMVMLSNWHLFFFCQKEKEKVNLI